MKMEFYDVKLRKKVTADVTEVKEAGGRRFALAKTEDGRKICRILGKNDIVDVAPERTAPAKKAKAK